MRPLQQPYLIHSISADATYSLPHHKSQGIATPYLRMTEGTMVPDQAVKDACINPVFAAKGSNLKECANFDADKAVSRSSSVYDITALFALQCRHHVVLAMCNLFTGEPFTFLRDQVRISILVFLFYFLNKLLSID